MNQNDVMKLETMLPEDFDGTFRFTNWSDEEFVATWGGRQYHFAAQTTSPMLIMDATPLEVQNIRKKFARDLAEREFFKSRKYEALREREGEKDDMGIIKPRANGMSHAGTFSLEELAPYIKRALEPLAVQRAVVTPLPIRDIEANLHRDEENNRITGAVGLGSDKDLEKLAKGHDMNGPQ